MTFSNHTHYNCEIILSDNTKYRVEANWLHNEHLDNWRTWECNAGHKRLMIDSDLTVYSGECLNDNLGNITTGWIPLTKSTICKQTRCTGCTDDLLQYKRKLNNDD